MLHRAGKRIFIAHGSCLTSTTASGLLEKFPSKTQLRKWRRRRGSWRKARIIISQRQWSCEFGAANAREAQGTRANDQVQESEKKRPDGSSNGGFHFPIRILVSGGKKRPTRHAWLITFQPAEMLNSPSLSEIPNSAEETAKPSWKCSHRIQQGDQKSVCQIPRHSRRKQTLMKSGRCWFQEAPWRNQKYRPTLF